MDFDNKPNAYINDGTKDISDYPEGTKISCLECDEMFLIEEIKWDGDSALCPNCAEKES